MSPWSTKPRSGHAYGRSAPWRSCNGSIRLGTPRRKTSRSKRNSTPSCGRSFSRVGSCSGYGSIRGSGGRTTASVLYLNRRGEAVGFDPFDSATNPHMVITGTSGSGKSFTVAHLANQVLPLGAAMVILDRLPSYQELCTAWNGQYLAMD